MGYVLPVERFQYVDYQNRQVENKLHVDGVSPVFKTVLEKKHEEITSEYNRLMPSSYKNIPLKPQMTAVEGAVYSEITGKGREFSESI